MIVRLATADDGPRIGQLYAEAKYPDHGVDWTAPGIAPWWLLAEDEGRLVGAVQVVAAQPYGYIGEILVHPSERGKRRTSAMLGDVATGLYLNAIELLHTAGVQVFFGTVAEHLKGLRRILLRHGVTDLGLYHLVGRRTA